VYGLQLAIADERQDGAEEGLDGSHDEAGPGSSDAVAEAPPDRDGALQSTFVKGAHAD
jgi:hypothetical protein